MEKPKVLRALACIIAMLTVPFSAVTAYAEENSTPVVLEETVPEETYQTVITVVDAVSAYASEPEFETDPSETETDPFEPETDPSEAGADPSEAGADPSEAGADPSEAGADPSEAGADPSEAGADPSEAGADPSEAGTDPSETETAPSETETDTAPSESVSETETNTSETTSETGVTETQIIDETRVPVADVNLSISKNTMTVGQTAQLSVTKTPENATDVLSIRYVSSDESVLTVSDSGVVTAKKVGTATVTAYVDTLYVSETGTSDCYTVLVLDISGSMSGKPIQVQHDAAVNFCKELLNENSTLKHHIAIVTLGTSAVEKTGFTDDLSVLETAIPTKESGGTNYSVALKKADEILSKVDEHSVRNIVFCSDGLPGSGTTSTTGPYTSSDSTYYKYANGAYDLANQLKSKYHIYTLGFFHSITDDKTLSFAGRLLSDIATDPKDFTQVINPDELGVAFTDISGRFITSAAVGHFEKSLEVTVNEAPSNPSNNSTPSNTKKTSSVTSSPKTGDATSVIINLTALSVVSMLLLRRRKK